MSEKDLPRATGATPTLHDVARVAGVSLATASRVVNGSERKVAEQYHLRVMAAAEQLGYTPNLSAQATARGSSAIIALLVADIADPYFGQIAAGVVRGADEAGLVVTISMTARDGEREARLVRALRGQRPRALILAASRSSHLAPDAADDELAAFAGNGGRVVSLGRGAAAGTAIEVDNVGGSAALGRMLSDLGYRRAIVLGAEEGVLTSDDRIDGFRQGFEAGGGSISAIYRGDFSRDSGRAQMERALADGIPAGTLVFGISDVVAIGALTAIRATGRSVGDDIALCGFDDVPAASDITPALTTVSVPLEELGYRALRAAIDPEATTDEALPLRVVIRGSTPRPRF